MSFHCKKLAVIGVGLIGGSLARALKQANAVDEVIGHGRNLDNLDQALKLGVIDRVEVDIEAAVADADIIVLCVPLQNMSALLASIARHKKAGAVVTDVGSAKQSVIAAALAADGDAGDWFVPGHPIAGAERSGVAASIADLFANHRVILTPMDNNPAQHVELISSMWEASGAIVSQMDAEHHDEVLAATSHLPHVLAYGLVDTLATLSDRREIFEYAAGGFRDFTRIAASDPVMWRDICLSNRDAVLHVLDKFTDDLASLKQSIKTSDGDALLETFTRSRSAHAEAMRRMAGNPQSNSGSDNKA